MRNPFQFEVIKKSYHELNNIYIHSLRPTDITDFSITAIENLFLSNQLFVLDSSSLSYIESVSSHLFNSTHYPNLVVDFKFFRRQLDLSEKSEIYYYLFSKDFFLCADYTEKMTPYCFDNKYSSSFELLDGTADVHSIKSTLEKIRKYTKKTSFIKTFYSIKTNSFIDTVFSDSYDYIVPTLLKYSHDKKILNSIIHFKNKKFSHHVLTQIKPDFVFFNTSSQETLSEQDLALIDMIKY